MSDFLCVGVLFLSGSLVNYVGFITFVESGVSSRLWGQILLLVELLSVCLGIFFYLSSCYLGFLFKSFSHFFGCDFLVSGIYSFFTVHGLLDVFRIVLYRWEMFLINYFVGWVSNQPNLFSFTLSLKFFIVLLLLSGFFVLSL